MSVNLEVKGMLARLLATEDIVVEHKKVETACFNVHTRVLTLPMWKASSVVVDLLVAHECGHSIFTDDIDWSKTRKIPPQFVNITEDARIEKLMKRKYAGLAKTFYGGYKELSDEDFFQLNDEDISTYNLADRANLYFKVGNFLLLNFTVEEQEIIDQIGAAETFADALDAAEVLYKYCKNKQQEETKINLDSHENQSSGSGSNSASDFLDQPEGENNQPEMEGGNGSSSDQIGEQKSEEQEQKVKSEQGGETSEPEVKTVDNLEESLKDLVNQDGCENVYVEIPKLNMNQIIANNVEVHNKCKGSWASYLDTNVYEPGQIFGEADKEFREFKRSAQKEVNYLVKEFECRKAADSYARATTARTGVLDCTKLHTYKYNEDLFRKVTTLADGKNHGLVFILDWSGSMNRVMLDTVKQLFNLIWFCKKVNIPFEVYAFTYDYPIVKYDENNKPIMSEPSYQKKDGLIHIHEQFSLMNILTSKTNSRTMEEQMLNVYRIARSFNHYSQYAVPIGWGLSGTPLNESLVALHQILPTFQKENKLQKVQCVILTDGEASSLKYHKQFNRPYDKEPYIGLNCLGRNAFLRDRKTGNTYSLDAEWHGFTDILLRNLRDNFSTVNFIGMRILESRDAGSFVRRYTGWVSKDYDKIMNTWKKEKSFSIKQSGYHSYFGLSSNTLSQDSGFDVAEDASKAQIKTAFVKSLRIKKMNKKVLGEFISLVA
jgi:hypothetical protein